MKAWSIKARVTIAVTLLVAALVAVVGGVQMHYLRAEFTQVLSDQQESLVSRTARDIDLKFETSTNVLSAFAATLTAAELQDPGALRTVLSRHTAMLALFDDVLIVTLDGRVVADQPEVEGRRGLDVSDREYFRQVIATRRPVITEPFLGKVRREPIVQIVVPVLSPDRSAGAMILGVIRLNRQNFLGGLGEERVGLSGHFTLLTRGKVPVYVSHPDRTRVMKPRPPNGSAPITRALNGFQGSDEGISSEGIENVYSSKLLRAVPWVLVGVAPKHEVLAPLYAAQQRLWITAALSAAGAMLLAWLLVWWLLAPLQRLRVGMAGLRGDEQTFVPVRIERADEVGDLTRAFNRLMESRVLADSARHASEARLRMIADNLPALVCYLGPDLRYQFANSRYEEWFGIKPEDAVGRSIADIFGVAAVAAAQAPLDAARGGQRVTYDREVPTLQGLRIARSVLQPQLDDNGCVMGIYCMTTDITGDHDARKKLSDLARHDSLTGLFNRLSFEERLPEALGRNAREARWMALLFLDLDRFKAVNDTLGHGAGDDVLKAVAARLEEAVRSSDTVARLAGDEFTVILEGLHSPQEAERIAEKLIAAIQLPIATRAGEARVGASIGVAACQRNVLDAEFLVRCADEASYAAKHAGRGCHRLVVAHPAPRLAHAA